ncbi:MAG: NADH-quinone oxidoreductase subunit C [Planctomycetota bacterium]|nr:NADH-quinone oxidoreductase subunit C [Planctomycetota bacterium]
MTDENNEVAVNATQTRVSELLSSLECNVTCAYDGMALVQCAPELLHAICAKLKTEGGFEGNTLVTAIDHGVGLEQRFEMVYQFLSMEHTQRVRVRAMTTGDDPEVDTITDLWPGTAFSERECFDLLGVRFAGHENLRRILMPEGFEHHPLRKDFPHIGIEPDKLYQKWDEERRSAFAEKEAGK